MNTLVCLLQGLKDVHTTVELRNENSVKGTIAHVDAYMNITMTNATFKVFAGKETYFNSFFISGRNVRFVLIPDEIDMLETIKQQVGAERTGGRSRRADSKWMKREKRRAKLVEKQKQVEDLISKFAEGATDIS